MRDPSAKERAFGVASRLGFGETALRLADSFHNLGDFDIDERIREYELDDTEAEGDVLITFTQGEAGTNAYRHCILAHAFRTRGYNPVIPLCSGDLPRCHRQAPDKTGSQLCDRCHYVGTEIADAFGLEVTPLRDLLSGYTSPVDNSELSSFERYKEVPVADYARASTRKFLQKYHIDLADNEERDVYRFFLDSATRLVDATEALVDRHNFVAAVGDHDNYIYGGIYLQYAHNQGIPTYSHAMGYREQTIMFGMKQNRSSIPPYSDEQVVWRRLDQSLSDEQEEHIDQIMQARATGDDTRIHYAARTNKSVDTDDGKPVLGLFTNLVWDASLLVEDQIWADVFEWIETTIEFARSCDDIRFVIKTHPAEAKLGTNESVTAWVEANYTPLPENITLLPPDTDVNTYEMFENIDAGVVFNSTAGLEMAYRGIPTIVAGDAHYMGFGFTHDATNRDEYHALLADPPTGMKSEEVQLAKRYSHLLFVQKHFDFPFVEHGDEDLTTTLLPLTHEELIPGNEPYDFIVDQILNNSPVIRGAGN